MASNGNQQVFYFDHYQRTTDYVEPRRTLSFIYDGVGNMTKMVEQGIVHAASDFFYNYGLRQYYQHEGCSGQFGADSL